MKYALDMASNLVCAADASRNAHYCDPETGERVVLCRGPVRDPYFARRADFDKRKFYDRDNAMSDWHKARQAAFPPDATEITFRVKRDLYRADVLFNGVEVEMQHSPMTACEFSARNDFYLSRPEISQIVWIFDASDWNIELLSAAQASNTNNAAGPAADNPQPQAADNPQLQIATFRWRRPRATFTGFVPPEGDGLSLLDPGFDSLFSDPDPAEALASQLTRQRDLTGSSDVEVFFEFDGILHRVLSCGTPSTLTRSDARKKIARHEASWRECDASGDFSGYWNDWSSFTADSSIPSIEDFVNLIDEFGPVWNR